MVRVRSVPARRVADKAAAGGAVPVAVPDADTDKLRHGPDRLGSVHLGLPDHRRLVRTHRRRCGGELLDLHQDMCTGASLGE